MDGDASQANPYPECAYSSEGFAWSGIYTYVYKYADKYSLTCFSSLNIVHEFVPWNKLLGILLHYAKWLHSFHVTNVKSLFVGS